MRCLRALVLFVAAAIGTTVPAAASPLPTTGDQIFVLPGLPTPTTFPAETPFHIVHGVVCSETLDCLDPATRFVLLVDGVETHAILDLEVEATGAPATSKFSLTNFRFGLPAGVHTFGGRWYARRSSVPDQR